MTTEILLLGGRGQIGSGLRTYLPRLDTGYRFTSVDLPGAANRAEDLDDPGYFVDFDISAEPQRLVELMRGRDLVIYLARKSPLAAMKKMTDAVFEALLTQDPVPMVIGASSVHACDSAYSVVEGEWAAWAERRFDAYDTPPNRIPATLEACPTDHYGEEKAYVERWCQKLAALGHGAIAARWGGINDHNEMAREHGYFALWCHQEDAARFVHACYSTFRRGALRSGAHYFVVSDNTYNIFDIDIPRREIGYEPVHDAEVFYRGKGDSC